ncbi:hypothetical protein EPUS_07800 [Endocarpon pusillum Z07020]|uniref:acylphosphatase n=1 Tax=Endocarpon pusillum (strain Z07020 / HMAS-L-300199) TaxID=1263415 RepID=U1GSY8_ENDPU|nr:uncharacterized protein EPUS_07800 [Endocarpon pusillum Z07020]ERF75111.1 hypothetical protein EPUS_07800 [Endocarpon pusillum Z07020]
MTDRLSRAFTQEKAQSYGITGFVKNTSDGKVEGEAQGNEDALQKFLKDINEGPKNAHVVKVEKSTIDTKDGESSFQY